MNLWKYGLVIVSISTLILSSGVVSAATQTVNDPENDVYNIDTSKPIGQQMTQNIGDQPNVDITQVSCVINDGTLTLKLVVASDGTVLTDDGYAYNLQARTSDGGVYSMMIAYGDSGGTGIGPSTPIEDTGGKVQISGNTFQMQWTFQGNATVTDLAGDASYSPTEKSVYRDIAPNEDSTPPGGTTPPGNTTPPGGTTTPPGDTTSTKKGTPGFEAIAVIAAVGISLILLKRRK